MKFSLIITTYNSEKYIEQALISVLNQTRLPDEIIICDDNSIDDTIKICENYKDKIIIHINKNGPSGYTNAFNYALKLGNGDYISILHFDDILQPVFFEIAENTFIKNTSCKFFACKNFYFKVKNEIPKIGSIIESIDTSLEFSGQKYGRKYLEGVKLNNHINRCPGTIFHKSLIDTIQFRVEAGLLSDDDLFYRVGLYTNVIYVKQPLVGVRLNEESESGKLDELKLNYEISKSYFFLINDWNKNNVLGHEGLKSFINLFLKHNFRALYWSLVIDNQKLYDNLKNQYQDIYNDYKIPIIKEQKIFKLFFYFLVKIINYNNLKYLIKFSK